MAILSALKQALCPPDDALRVLTYLSKEDAPDYYLHFTTPKTHTGEKFVLDKHSEIGLLPDRLVDPLFLAYRYERLFPHKTRRGYYCVPWMGVRHDIDQAGNWTLSANDFELVLAAPVPAPSFPSGKRTLVLTTSGPGTAAWRNPTDPSRSHELKNIDISKLTGTAIDIHLPNTSYDDDGVIVTIEDADDAGKAVGRLRIVFLETITVKALCLVAEEVVDQGIKSVRVRRMLPSECPRSLESQGETAGYAHGYITDDANKYGFGPVGIDVDFSGDDLTIMNPDGGTFLDAGIPLQTSFDSIHLPATGRLASLDPVRRLLGTLSSHIAKFSIGGEERSQFSAIIVLVTPFSIADGTMGASYNGETDDLESEKAKDRCWSNTRFHNASLFTTEADEAPTTWRWKANGCVENKHRFTTLIHEVSHALMLEHIFADEKKDEFDQVVSEAYHLADAHRWLRLYIKGLYVSRDEMYESFDDYKITPQDFKISESNGRDLTVFDAAITLGLKDVIDAYIEKLFPVSQRPASWSVNSLNRFYARELVFWSSLNDLVEYKDSPANVMENGDGLNYAFKPNSGTNSAPQYEWYIRQTPAHFNRFQWEVLRRSAEYFQKIGPL